MAQRILLVEDDEEFSSLYQRQLTEAGYETIVCITAGQAMEKLRNSKVDLVVLGILLPPSKDGITLLKKIKGDEKTADIPVVMLTNIQDEKLMQQAMDLGAAGYIVKISTTPSDFIIQVKTFLPKESTI